MVHVTQQLLLLLLVLKLLAGVAHDEAREERARVCGGVDQAVDDIVTRGGDHCHLNFTLHKKQRMLKTQLWPSRHLFGGDELCWKEKTGSCRDHCIACLAHIAHLDLYQQQDHHHRIIYLKADIKKCVHR